MRQAYALRRANSKKRRTEMSEQQQPFVNFRRLMASLLMTAITLGTSVTPAFASSITATKHVKSAAATATPIQYLVVIFQENVSFDHYFGTYPSALNPPFENKFKAALNTPTVNGLSNALLNFNPNLNPSNPTGASNPFRLDVSQAATGDQDHNYLDEQLAFDSGLMDLFPTHAGNGKSLVMGYFDGNTVTALWNYAQYFAMSDNSYSTTFGPSTPGLMNLIAGQTNGATTNGNLPTDEVAGGPDGSLTVVGDPDPLGDICSNPTRDQVTMSSNNIGDLLEASGVTWGSFMGGYDLTVVNPNGTTGCARSTKSNITGGTVSDYIPHHSFFNYWTSTANPNHTRPVSVAEIGNDGPANHNYDINDFFAAVNNGSQPAVSFLKAPSYQDGHAGYSDPTDEQHFLVNTLNALQAGPNWSSTAVVIMYDDSDGWYDHQMGPIVNTSTGPADGLTGPEACGNAALALAGANAGANPHALGRCGYGPRQPLLVISPWARQNFVDHTVTDQTSVTRFIEDNWLGGQRLAAGSFDTLASPIDQMFNFTKIRANGKLILNPLTGNKH
jgi:phospholipase C